MWMSKASRVKPLAHFVVDGMGVCSGGWTSRFIPEIDTDPRCPRCAWIVAEAEGVAGAEDITLGEARILFRLLETNERIRRVTPAVKLLVLRGLVMIRDGSLVLSGNGITLAADMYQAGSSAVDA